MDSQVRKGYRWLLAVMSVLGILVVGAGGSVSVHADGGAPNLAYVAIAGKGVKVIDIAKQDVVSTFDIAGDPHALFLSYDGRFLYTTQPEQRSISIVAARTGKVICSARVPGKPEQLVMDVNKNVLYVAGNQGSTVMALDHQTCAVKHLFESNEHVYGVGLVQVSSADGLEIAQTQLWVATERGLSIFDADKGKQIGTIAIADGPEYITAPMGTSLYLTTRKGSVLAVDTATRKISTLIEGGSYGPMDYDGVTGEIYVPDRKHKELVILSPVIAGSPMQQQPERRMKLQSVPEAVAITSDGQLGFVALEDGNVLMLDVPGRQQVKSISVGAKPNFIITGLYPPVVGSTPEEATWEGNLVQFGAYAILAALFFVPLGYFGFRTWKKRAG